jgi:hypothetical protein
MNKSKDPATKSKPDKELADKELADKASGGHGSPAPVGGPGTYPTPDQREHWDKPAKG